MKRSESEKVAESIARVFALSKAERELLYDAVLQALRDAEQRGRNEAKAQPPSPAAPPEGAGEW